MADPIIRPPHPRSILHFFTNYLPHYQLHYCCRLLFSSGSHPFLSTAPAVQRYLRHGTMSLSSCLFSLVGWVSVDWPPLSRPYHPLTQHDRRR
jgi:hypothetical protein